MKTRLYRIYILIQKILKFRLQFKNWDSILKRILLGKNILKIEVRNGLSINPGIGLHGLSIYHEIFSEEVYNPEGFKIQKGDIVIDIGANIGIFTLYAKSRGCAKVYSFEPHPKNFELLSSNILDNKLNNVIVYNVAVTYEKSVGLLKSTDMAGHHKILDSSSNESGIQVKTINFDDFVKENNLTQIDFLKIDCEGSEGNILLSLSNEVFNKIKRISLEYHDRVSILKHQEIINLLNQNDFDCTLRELKNGCGLIYARK